MHSRERSEWSQRIHIIIFVCGMVDGFVEKDAILKEHREKENRQNV